jgi:hypothetical protein
VTEVLGIVVSQWMILTHLRFPSSETQTTFQDGAKDEILRAQINFTLDIDTSGTSALHHQTIAAVSQAQEDAARIRAVPTSLGVGTGIDIENAAATDAFTPLLNKVAKFNDIVKDIANVRRHLDFCIGEGLTKAALTDSPICPDGVENSICSSYCNGFEAMVSVLALTFMR